MGMLIGWDIGGAHLKGVRVEDGVITKAVQLPCPLWQGLDKLEMQPSRRRFAASVRPPAMPRR